MGSPDDSLRHMRHSSDVIAAVLHEVATLGASDTEVLKTHPGKGLSNLQFGMHRVMELAADRGASADGIIGIERKVRSQYVKGAELCESPIERNMLAALLTGRWSTFDALPPLVHDHRKDKGEMFPVCPVVIVPQMAFVRFRLDFGIVVVKNRKLQIVAVECDGKAFHQDAVKENERTAYLHSWDIPVFKVKGSDLYENAIEQADRVIAGISEWAER